MTELTPTARPDDDVRVGDAERRAVDERLHAAVGDGVLTLGEYEERCTAVWAARTRGDLAVLVRDLPGAAVAAPPGGPTRRAIAVMSDERLQGPVGAGQAVEGYAVMGSSHVDLRRADLPPVVTARAFALMGEVEVLVPDGASVELSGMSVMGDRSVRLDAAVPGAPVVRLSAYAVMGSVKVRSGPVQGGGVVPGAWQPSAAPLLAAGGAPARRRRIGRNGLVGLAIAGVVIAGAAGGGGGGGSDDEEIFLRPGQPAHVIGGGSRDKTVVVPDGLRAVVSKEGGSGEVECETACLASAGEEEVQVRVLGGSGDVEIVTEEEFEDD